jgi:hypothetical protein
MSRFLSFSLRGGLAALALAAGFAATPAMAQDGQTLRRIFGQIGLLPPADKEEIIYHDRPGLVVPKDLNRLRTPEEGDPEQRNARWPNDPDRERRRQDEARRNLPSAELMSGRRATDGARVGLDEAGRSRVARGTPMGEPDFTRNDQAGVRVSAEEWSRVSRAADAGPRIAPGTEPPRQYLTDPPRGLRIPAAGAPIARTQDGPREDLLDNGRPQDAWRRLD